MATTLVQSQTAAFPDRGVIGLRATLSQGGGGEYLQWDLNAEQQVIYVRWLMAVNQLAGGPVVMAAGFDDAGTETFRTAFDPDGGALTVQLATGQTLTASLHVEFDWHAVELGIDTADGAATLSVNGVQRDEISGSLATLATRTCWFGVILKHTDAVGELWLDEWAIADGPIGPVLVQPTSDHADDPARWLVIYNTTVAESVTWVQSYRDARGIPYANLLGLDLPTSELIDAAAFAALNDAIEQYLANTGLSALVMGVLIGYRVPGYVDFTGSGTRYAIDDLLHRAGDGISVGINANAADVLPQRPTKSMLGVDRLTARLDGPDLAAVNNLMSKADALAAANGGGGLDSTLYLDPFAGSGPLFYTGTQNMVNWSQSIDRQRLRLPMQLSGPLDSTTPQQFDAISDDGFFWGWGQPAPPSGFFAEPAGRRIVCAQFDLTGPTATTVRSTSASNWITAPLTAGYAAAIAVSRTISAATMPYARPFFEASRNGWTLAEAMYVAKPLLRDGLHLVGDPLLRVNLPRAGWDVLGPLDSLEQLDPAQPVAALRLDETEFAVSACNGLFVVRRVDEHGRQEAGLTLISAVNLSGVAARPILKPAWPPSEDHWSPRVREGQVELIAAWDRSLQSAGIQGAQLCSEVDGESESVLATPDISPRARMLQVVLAMPAESGRYRWRITSVDGAVWLSPWSLSLQPRPALAAALQTMELA
ncbi:MAG: hypothetical protein IT445_12780 [Phycisphaeraceae bacterium]|nr:hypothetical protein [Phycisphaeraceae bacterium]